MFWMQNDEKVYQRICLPGNTCAIRVQPLSWPQSHQPFESVAVALDNFLCQSPLQLQQNRGLPWVLGRTIRMLFWLRPISYSHSSHLPPLDLLLLHVIYSKASQRVPYQPLLYFMNNKLCFLLSPPEGSEMNFYSEPKKNKKLIGMYLFLLQ